MPTVVDLFSGAGGASAGFRAAGFELVGAVDAQRGKPSSRTATRCNATYELNHGIAPLDLDLAAIDPPQLAAHLPSPDVLIACAPCTGFSQKQAANHLLDDARNALVPKVAAFAEALAPDVVVMENVKELLAGRHRHHFARLTSRLEALGYAVTAEVHDLSRFGLPQLRRRALVLASRLGPLAHPAPTTRTPVTVRQAIAGIPADDPMHVAPRSTPPVLQRIRATPRDGGSWADVAKTRPDLLIPSMRDKRPGSFPDVYGRLWWDQPARTITRECGHPGNGRYLHPEEDRLLTVREMAILQGFPRDYTFAGPLAARYNQIGDAVPPLFARRVAVCVQTHLDAFLKAA